jgi:hemerythrin-like domain-containing protein
LLTGAGISTAAGGRQKEKAMPAQKSTTRRKPAREGKDGQKNAIALLKEDHERVRKLLGELEETTDRAEGKREKLLKTIEEELTIHTKIEEDVFYPAFFDAAKTSEDKELYYESMEEHHVVDLVMPEVKGTDTSTNEFAAKAKVLKDLVEHHAEEEESEMFPRARKLMDRERLMELGEELARAKESARAGILEKLTGGMIRS